MCYRRAIANCRDFFRPPGAIGTPTAARTITQAAVARARGAAARVGALHPLRGALFYCSRQRGSTGPRAVKGRARIAVALLIAGVLAAPALFSSRDALSAEYTLMPSPETVHIGHFSAALKPVLTINSGDIVTIEIGRAHV